MAPQDHPGHHQGLALLLAALQQDEQGVEHLLTTATPAQARAMAAYCAYLAAAVVQHQHAGSQVITAPQGHALDLATAGPPST